MTIAAEGAVPALAAVAAIAVAMPLGMRRLRRGMSAFACPACGRTFRRRGDYRAHYSMRHSARAIPEPVRCRAVPGLD